MADLFGRNQEGGVVARCVQVALIVPILALLARTETRASLHHPDEPMAVPVTSRGEPEALPFDEFSRRRAVLMNLADPNRPLVNPNNPAEKSDRGKVLDRVEKLKNKFNRTPEESTALAVDLLRLGRPDEASGAFQRQQRTGFLANVTLAHAAAAQGEWGQAFEYLDIANGLKPPAAVPGITSAQLAWQLTLNRGPLAKLFKARWTEAREKEQRRRDKQPEPPPDDERPDPIFAVNWANTADGSLAPAETSALPADALAVVQQLVLWFPGDPRLYWLLAEVYAAKGEFAPAQRIMDSLAESFKYSNRKLLMQHREAVTKAAAAAAEAANAGADDPPAQPDPPFSLGAVWAYFGVVGVIALFALVRALTKKRRDPNDCGPVG